MVSSVAADAAGRGLRGYLLEQGYLGSAAYGATSRTDSLRYQGDGEEGVWAREN